MMRAQGFAQQGAQIVWTAGHASTTVHQETFPYATVSVYDSGSVVLSTIYADNAWPLPTPQGNPFTADADGNWFFYAANGRYDVMVSVDGLPVRTLGDLLLFDPAEV